RVELAAVLAFIRYRRRSARQQRRDDCRVDCRDSGNERAARRPATKLRHLLLRCAVGARSDFRSQTIRAPARPGKRSSFASSIDHFFLCNAGTEPNERYYREAIDAARDRGTRQVSLPPCRRIAT